eukprot:COSAG01_NODE_1767_length_9258_cov_3.704523_2_plen_64_part_00
MLAATNLDDATRVHVLIAQEDSPCFFVAGAPGLLNRGKAIGSGCHHVASVSVTNCRQLIELHQ